MANPVSDSSAAPTVARETDDGHDRLDREAFSAALTETRERTLALVEGLPDETLEAVHSKLLSPLAWDLAHIAAFEDLWISRLSASEQLRPELTATYDADETPRAQRGDLELLSPGEAFAFLDAVRDRTLALLESDRLLDPTLLELVIRHEQQHNETMLQAFQLAHLRSPFGERPASTDVPEGVSGLDFVAFPGGEVAIGAGDEHGFAYDNERPRHRRELSAFLLGRSPVTNADWQRFIDAGGYERAELWSPDGWSWRQAQAAQHPQGWTSDGRQWVLDALLPIEGSAPVIHVSWWEAEAFANFAGARLPSEFEWELAATLDPQTGTQLRLPWGEQPVSREFANVDQLGGGAMPVGAFPDGSSPTGLLSMIGDVWEWTASSFDGYPGFHAYPYREYSEQFFGDRYRVLRGCSWATRARVASATFRNWDLPQRRQIFSGLRLAKDPE